EPNRADDVPDLAFDHEYHRVVTKPGVGAEQEEQVRETCGGDAEMGLNPFVRPYGGEFTTGRTLEPEVVEPVGYVETGGIDDHVDRTLVTGLGYDGVLGDLGDPVGDDGCSGPIQRWVVVTGTEDSFAPDAIRGGELLAQRGIINSPRYVPLCDTLERTHEIDMSVQSYRQ